MKVNRCLSIVFLTSPLLHAAESVKTIEIIRDGRIGTTGYRYSSQNKRNPFMPPLAKNLEKSVEDTPITNSLQQHALTELHVVGIWKVDNNDNKALIVTPNNEGIVAQIGTLIGLNQGEIVKIESDFIRIREYSTSLEGVREFEDFDLPIGEGVENKVVKREESP